MPSQSKYVRKHRAPVSTGNRDRHGQLQNSPKWQIKERTLMFLAACENIRHRKLSFNSINLILKIVPLVPFCTWYNNVHNNVLPSPSLTTGELRFTTKLYQ